MKTNNFTMNFNAPVGEVKPLQTETESILARMNAVENGLSQSVLENFRANKGSIVL